MRTNIVARVVGALGSVLLLSTVVTLFFGNAQFVLGKLALGLAGVVAGFVLGESGGLKRFFTGKPCKRGHIAERTVCDQSCMKCVYENTRKRRAADPETARETQRRWRAANLERARKDSRRWYAENKDRILSERAAKRAANREEAREYQRRWRAKNKDKIYSRRAAQRHAAIARSRKLHQVGNFSLTNG